VQEPLPGVTITARFDDGQVSGSAGCNRYQGPYSDVEGALTVGPLGVTKQMCGEPEDIMPQEDQFLAQLSSAIDARASGDQLWLLLEDGSALLFTATGSQ
jgi:heat shock protein HslJ